MSSAYLIVSVTYAGTVIRLSTAEIDITDAAEGVTYSYYPGMGELTVSTAMEFLQSSAGALSVPVSAVFPVSVAQLHAQGHQLARSPAEIAIWTEGTDYAARIILARGTVSDPEWGEPQEVVAFSIEDAAKTSTVEVPNATQQVDGYTWPATILDLATDELGLVYPRIYGSPGAISTSMASWVAGSQALTIRYIDTPGFAMYLVVAGHAMTTPYVQLSTDEQTTARQFHLYTFEDGRGQTVTGVTWYNDYPSNTAVQGTDADFEYVYGFGSTLPDVAGIVGATKDAPVKIYCTWYDPVDASRGGLSPKAGDVILDMLQLAGMAVDYGRIKAAAGLLSAFRFDCVVSARVKPLEWLQAQILPLLPVSVDRSGDGASLIVWRYDATPEDATAVLDADTDTMIERATSISVDSADIINRWSMNYAYSVRTGQYCEVATRGNDTVTADGVTTLGDQDAYCLASQARYGVIEKTIESACVYDDATAGAILAWMARAYAFPRRTVGYVVPSSYQLHKGQIVRLTDAKVSITDQLAIVAELQIDGTGTDAVSLLMIEDPQRDPKVIA
jgi:hypothetical protein